MKLLMPGFNYLGSGYCSAISDGGYVVTIMSKKITTSQWVNGPVAKVASNKGAIVFETNTLTSPQLGGGDLQTKFFVISLPEGSEITVDYQLDQLGPVYSYKFQSTPKGVLCEDVTDYEYIK